MARLYPLLACAMLLVSAPVHADDPTGVNGFITFGTGELTGRVTDMDGKAMSKTEVHIVPDVGAELVVKTDKAGRFKAVMRGQSQTLVFVRAKARITAQVAVPSPDHPDGEVVEIHETLPPAVMPKPFQERTKVPPYSSSAIQKDAWVRGHVLLDVDALGHVSRIKLLDAPGYDLDTIAIDQAFKLGFVPAKDRSGNSVPAMVVWTFEWPSFWWLKQRKYLPAESETVPCRGSGPSTTRFYRDCSTPSMGKAVNLPWIEPPPPSATTSGAPSPTP